MWLWAEAIVCYSLCTGAVEARADVAGAGERLCTGLSLSAKATPSGHFRNCEPPSRRGRTGEGALLSFPPETPAWETRSRSGAGARRTKPTPTRPWP
jgi:hypothetical protein